MNPPRQVSEPRPLTSEELRRIALARSQQRGRFVAQRRVAMRWLSWCALKAARWVLPPALALAGLWWLGERYASFRQPDASPAAAAARSGADIAPPQIGAASRTPREPQRRGEAPAP